MVRHSVLALAATFVIGSAAIAQDAAPVDPDKKICRRDVATGSVMTKRICHTKAEWDAMSAQAAKDRDRVLDQERARNNVGLSRQN